MPGLHLPTEAVRVWVTCGVPERTGAGALSGVMNRTVQVFASATPVALRPAQDWMRLSEAWVSLPNVAPAVVAWPTAAIRALRALTRSPVAPLDTVANIAASVFGPASPSVSSFFAAWNFLTALTVAES